MRHADDRFLAFILNSGEDLFKIQGYHGNENYYEPENSYVNKVIDRREGNPISLCLIYLLLLQFIKTILSLAINHGDIYFICF